MQPSMCAHLRSCRLWQRPHGPVNSGSAAWLPRVSRFSLSWATGQEGPPFRAASLPRGTDECDERSQRGHDAVCFTRERAGALARVAGRFLGLAVAVLDSFRFAAMAPADFLVSTASFGFFFAAVLEAETRDFAGVFAATAGTAMAEGVSASAISIPKTSARSPAAMVFLPRDLPAPATGARRRRPRSTRGGQPCGAGTEARALSSSRAPTPYITAATCLHIPAQSGQEHFILISAGFGNRPPPRAG